MVFLVFLFAGMLAEQQQPPKTESGDGSAATPEPKTGESSTEERSAEQRAQLNLMGQTDASKGESRRNENVQFNLIDTNTLKDLNVRLGTTPTLVPEFRAETSYFSVEFGNPPSRGLHLAALPAKLPGPHGSLYWTHGNSVFSARAFFQAGAVKPARENDYGFQFGMNLSKRVALSVDGRQQRVRGFVNGNVLVPLGSERTPLATDPAVRAVISRWLTAFPSQLPNRTDIDPRALNTNAAQRINTDSASVRLDNTLSAKDRLGLSWAFTAQDVSSFQLVAGQNPDTDTHSHTPRITWSRAISASTTTAVTAGFDRLNTRIRLEPNAVGPTVGFSGALTGLGPSPPIPILRAQNKFRYGGQIQQVRGRHTWAAGGDLVRSQINGLEQDGDRGIYTFANDFGRDSITNFRMGAVSRYAQAIGNNWRGFRAWNFLLYAGDKWQVHPNLTVDFGLRFEPVTTPTEVNKLDVVPYPCDCNNFAPRFGFAWRMPRKLGRLRGAYGIHYGEIFATTYSQVRMSPPGSYRIALGQTDILNPLGSYNRANLKNEPAGQFIVSPNMVTPYSHQYNLSWEPQIGEWKVQLGYVGSRTIKLFQMWFENRSRVLGVPLSELNGLTLNSRRPNPSKLEVFRLLNSSRAYYDAGRATLLVPRRWRFSGEISYWLGHAIDLGNDYTATLSGADARTGRSQSERIVHEDLKGPTSFDQRHAFLLRGTFEAPRLPAANRAVRQILGGWTLASVLLAKNGTPFTIESGSDAPGFGNVDGQGGDRMNVFRPEVLGRTIGNPDTSAVLLPRDAFGYIPLGEERGNLGRNTFHRGRIANMNTSLSRNWVLSHERVLEFRAESINFLNTPQFAEPTKELTSPSFGKITNTLNDGRTFRFQLRLRF